MATHSSILAWEIPEEPGGLQSMGVTKSRTQLSEHWRNSIGGEYVHFSDRDNCILCCINLYSFTAY